MIRARPRHPRSIDVFFAANTRGGTRRRRDEWLRQLTSLSLLESFQSIVSAQISATMEAISRFAANSSAPRRCISPSNAFPSSLTQLTSVRSTRIATLSPACSQQLRSSFTQAPASLPSSLKVVTLAPLLFVILSIAIHYCWFSLPLLP